MGLMTAAEKVEKRTLVHICCAPDAAYGLIRISELVGEVIGHFFNPNIHPYEEYEKRLAETVKISSSYEVDLVTGEYDQRRWDGDVAGLEGEPEGGKRCEACIRMRLTESAALTKNLGMDAFTTVLTISPKKDAAMVNREGKKAANMHGLDFLELDLKKEEGFKKSIVLSKEYGLYRQNYCGCKYSIR